LHKLVKHAGESQILRKTHTHHKPYNHNPSLGFSEHENQHASNTTQTRNKQNNNQLQGPRPMPSCFISSTSFRVFRRSSTANKQTAAQNKQKQPNKQEPIITNGEG